MPRLSARVVLCLLVLALVALPAFAEVYHVKLRNGAVLDTLYQPQAAGWDPSLALVLTDVGNWIGVRQDEIASVSSDSQARGFGVAINTTTIAIGWAPNDAAEPTQQQGNAANAADQAIQQLLAQQQALAHYTVPQGVSSEHAQGIPSGFIGYGNATGSVMPRYTPPVVATPAPATTMPATATPAPNQ